jgi:hypothetical protein
MRSSLLLACLLCWAVPAWAGVQCSTDDRVIVNDASTLRLTGSFTLAAWVNVVDFGGNGRGRILNKRVGSDGYNYPVRSSVGTGVNTFAAAINDSLSGNPTIVWAPDDSVVTGTWQHVAFTYNVTGNAVQHYINGSAVTTSAAAFSTAPLSNTEPLNLCNNNVGDDTTAFNGAIDDVYIFTDVLTAAQVKQLASSKLRRLALHNAKVLYLPMTNCKQASPVNGVVFPDRSWHGNNGTGDDGANNAGLTCETMGARLRYQRGVE